MRLFKSHSVAQTAAALPISWHMCIECIISEQYKLSLMFFIGLFLPALVVTLLWRKGFYKYALVFLGLPLAIDAFVIYIANIFFLYYIFKIFTYWFITKRFLDYVDYCSDKYEKTPRVFDL